MGSSLDYFGSEVLERPDRAGIVTALLTAETAAKRRGALPIDLGQLGGTWRLRFITGTQTIRRAVKLGPGRFIPSWVTIELGVSSLEETNGTIHNRVRLGALDLELTGPCRTYSDRRILAFDFTHLRLAIGPITLYRGQVRNPQIFAEGSLKTQAFFSFFVVDGDRIAARGRGGGLAIWSRVKSESLVSDDRSS
jgi:hypothetical protein